MRLIARPVAFGFGSVLIFAALVLLPPVRAAADTSHCGPGRACELISNR
jgi:hypothetical protein